jgi:N-methylhydantoinase A
MFVGVDIGGTFTDFAVFKDGRLTIHKRLSTPTDPSQAMLDGLTELTGGDLTRLVGVAHGTTVATNAILERKGAKAALLVTAGFRDILAIGRQERPDLYALHPRIPAPVIPRQHSFEVDERLDHTGAVLRPLDPASLDAACAAVRAAGLEAAAVCLLYSFLNPTHEQAVRRALHALLGDSFPVVLSSEASPEFREYERANTTAIEATVRPVIGRYVDRLAAAIPAPLRVMRSDGGVMSADRVGGEAAQTALSGPAAGVIGALHLAKLAGFEQLITLDMGGTSTDVALLAGGSPLRREGAIDGLPLRVPMLDIETVGAGGGSLARLDSGGALRVGPESAGASPGPACYGRGGDQPTVTDANLLVGRIDPARFLGGRMALDIDAARRAFQPLADALKMTVEQAAEGILAVADANIERAVRRVSVARGHDPRQFTLAAFGGAGGLHACAVAERLGMRRVWIPRYPGVLCAVGLLLAQVEVGRSRSVLIRLGADGTADLSPAVAAYTALRDECAALMTREGVAPHTTFLDATVDMRYQGQAFELPVSFAALYGPALRSAFDAAHQDAYGHAFADRPVEITAVRVRMRAQTPPPEFTAQRQTPRTLTGAAFDRDSLTPGMAFGGAAVITQGDATTYVPAGWRARVDGFGNLVLERVN